MTEAQKEMLNFAKEFFKKHLTNYAHCDKILSSLKNKGV